ncbi:hypothetical protein B4586_01425 [Lacticaseibacillus paracasei]|nr:hypothetical protein B4586_01425 [Lacticaseibacillus paracasei]
MLTKRIIPCLDVDHGRVKKGINFVQLKDVGDPVAIAKAYQEQGADELVFLDRYYRDQRSARHLGSNGRSSGQSSLYAADSWRWHSIGRGYARFVASRCGQSLIKLSRSRRSKFAHSRCRKIWSPSDCCRD